MKGRRGDADRRQEEPGEEDRRNRARTKIPYTPNSTFLQKFSSVSLMPSLMADSTSVWKAGLLTILVSKCTLA